MSSAIPLLSVSAPLSSAFVEYKADVPKSRTRTTVGVKRPTARVDTTPQARFLSCVLRMGKIPRSHIELAQKAINRYGSLSALFHTSADELAQDPWIGSIGAANLEAANRIIYQEAYAPLRKAPLFSNFDKLINYLLLRVGRAKLEVVHVLSLDVRSHLLDDSQIAIGSTSFVQIDIKTILAHALKYSAHRIIVVHNHPSGSPEPSDQDIRFTQLIRRACAIVGLELADHIIVSGNRWFSFKQSGLLDLSQDNEVCE